jgi:alpha-ketoglutaric semialdehyde dehydrogenase
MRCLTKNRSLMMATLNGRSLLGFREGMAALENFYAVNPATGERLDPAFSPATPAEVESAAHLASESFLTYARTSGRERGAFLRRIAGNIEGRTSELVERAHLETALPKPRLQSEAARTCGQLRLFAQVAEEGSWVAARIDRADPDRKPLPKSDIRSLLRPLGPVAVFGASNFPLAFSVAGGDTASALAAGNPVIVKAHPAHPGTSELAGLAIRAAVRESGLPEGVFSLLFDSGVKIGVALVTHPLVKAVGFTGSRNAGRALMDLAASRPEPIPFFGEMSSTNPVFLLPGALREQSEKIASGLHASFTLGAGQFCTKPGMVFLPQVADQTTFVQKLRDLVNEPADFHLLTASIHSSYRSAVSARKNETAVTSVMAAANQGSELGVGAVLFETDAASFLGNPDLAHEVFGPTTLLVQHCEREELLKIAHNLEGHLTATIHATEGDLRDYADLIAILESKVGRLVLNGFPTGVEVTHAMVHGGPYPATSDGRSTSVGSQAIFRFSRPVCYQSFPDYALPEELQDANPLSIWRMLDGQMTREAIHTAPVSKAG